MKCWRGLLLVVWSLAGSPAWSWWGDGHILLTRAALLTLPEELPAFFRQGGEGAGYSSVDPDLARNRALPRLYSAERAEHYLDLELLAGRPLPEKRYEFLQLCAQAGLDPTRVGLGVYAVAEWTERLALAFAEHRRWPDDPLVQGKCLIFAGFLAHYAQDLCQPLHATVHFDGRAGEDGKPPHIGIHDKVDALIERLNFAPEELAGGQEIAPVDSLMPAIIRQVKASNARVDSVYALEGELDDPRSPRVQALALERAREAVRFTAGLYLTAWELSGQVELPEWFRR